MMEKMTKKDYFEALKGFVAGDEREAEFVAFLDRQIELATKKRTGETKTQKENKELAEVVYAVVSEMEAPATVTDICKDERLAGKTNQKVTALLRMLVNDGRVTRTVDGKKTLYAIAE